MADFDPEAYAGGTIVTGQADQVPPPQPSAGWTPEQQPIVDRIQSGQADYTFGPGSPDPSQEDLQTYVGGRYSPASGFAVNGGVALAPSEYNLFTPEQRRTLGIMDIAPRDQEGKVERYYGAGAQGFMGPGGSQAGKFDPHAYANGTITSPLDAHAYLEPEPAGAEGAPAAQPPSRTQQVLGAIAQGLQGIQARPTPLPQLQPPGAVLPMETTPPPAFGGGIGQQIPQAMPVSSREIPGVGPFAGGINLPGQPPPATPGGPPQATPGPLPPGQYPQSAALDTLGRLLSAPSPPWLASVEDPVRQFLNQPALPYIPQGAGPQFAQPALGAYDELRNMATPANALIGAGLASVPGLGEAAIPALMARTAGQLPRKLARVVTGKASPQEAGGTAVQTLAVVLPFVPGAKAALSKVRGPTGLAKGELTPAQIEEFMRSLPNVDINKWLSQTGRIDLPQFSEEQIREGQRIADMTPEQRRVEATKAELMRKEYVEALRREREMYGQPPWLEGIAAEAPPPGAPPSRLGGGSAPPPVPPEYTGGQPPPVPPQPPPLPPGSVKTNPVSGSGKFRRTYKIDKELGDRLEQIGATPETGKLVASQHLNKMLKGLDKQQVENVGKYLVSKRLQSLNPGHSQVLNPLQEAQMLRDSKVQKAIDYYQKNVKPEIEGYRLRAGLSPQAAMSKGPEFMSLIPKEAPTGGGRLTPFAQQPKTRTSFANAAHGFAPEYKTDVNDILPASYSEAMRAAYNREFVADAESKGVADNPIVQAQLHSANPQLRDQPSGPVVEGLRSLQEKTVGLALTANPGELFNHMRRQFNILAGKPPVGASPIARTVEALIPYIGPKTGAFARTVTTDMSLPENQAILRDIFDAGGGSTRGFGESYRQTGPIGKYTGVKWLQDKAHQLLFGLPEGKGIGGWDLRMRVQLEKIRRAAEGNNDPQAIREFANQIGQYGSQNDWLIGAAKAINPYAGTTLPMRWTELKQMVGTSGLQSQSALESLGRRGETLLRGTGGTLLGMAAANYAMSGHWPWQNAPGHQFDLETNLKNPDGTPRYLKMRVLAPELSRPLTSTGIPEALREGSYNNPQYIAAVGRALQNQGLSIVASPLTSTVLTATTGRAPYLVREQRTGGSQLMNLLPNLQPDQSRGAAQMRAAVAGLNPWLQMLMGAPRGAGAGAPAMTVPLAPTQGSGTSSLLPGSPVSRLAPGRRGAAAPVSPLLPQKRRRR